MLEKGLFVMMFIDIVKLSFVDCIIRDFTVSAFKEFTCTPISIFVTLSSDINVDVCNNLRLMLYMYYCTRENFGWEKVGEPYR